MKAQKTIHKLKIKKVFFDDIRYGHKRFELRRNDRNYSAGDQLVMTVCDLPLEEADRYELYIQARINYVLTDFEGLDPEYCIFGLENPTFCKKVLKNGDEKTV